MRILPLLAILLLSSCASRKHEQFEDSFFAYQDKGKQYFSFILELKGALSSQNEFEFANLNNDPQQSGRERQQAKRQVVAQPENPEDALVSLKFRMEEIAHRKLKQRFENTPLCPNEISYEKDEFADFTYKIKGYCLP